MSPISAAAYADPDPATNDQRKLVILLLLAAVADWLLYDREPGLSVVIFYVALAVGVRFANPAPVPRRTIAVASGVLAVALLPLVESFGTIAVLCGFCGAAYFALALTRSVAGTFVQQLMETVAVVWTAPFRFLADIPRIARAIGRARALTAGRVTVWILPVALGGVFLALFAAANPLIESWLAQVDLLDVLSRIDSGRIVLWSVVVVAAWPLVFVTAHLARPPAGAAAIHPSAPDEAAPAGLFGEGAILRSLVLFNALFAVETVLDMTYLWGGVTLPDGMSYAGYAHRGAYPLVLTALLAGGFVIAAMRPGGRVEGLPLIRTLVHLWILQNVLLVGSAMLRLDSYVQVYSLTYWRVAAFVWMLLVAAGLVLLVLRIARRRSNAWLVSTNTAMLALVLYACSFVNFPYLIAAYNVAHCREISGKGQPLDAGYLMSLGPDIIPAIDEYRRRLPEARLVLGNRFDDGLLLALARGDQDWRQWSFRRWRLARYLENRPRG